MSFKRQNSQRVMGNQQGQKHQTMTCDLQIEKCQIIVLGMQQLDSIFTFVKEKNATTY
jgi:hypothetical protein